MVHLASGKSNLDVFETNFMKHADNFTKVDVFVGTISGSSPCFNITLNSNVNGSFDKIYVLSDNSGANFSLDGNGNISIENKYSDTYEIYLFSFDTTDKNLASSSCADADVNYSILLTGKIFSSETLTNFSMNYTKDYSGLKKQWDFPNDFTMTIKYENGTTLLEMSKEKPINTEVLSKSFMIKIFSENEKKIINAIVSVQIW